MELPAVPVYTIKILTLSVSQQHQRNANLLQRAFCASFSLEQSRYHHNCAVLIMIWYAVNKW